MKRLITIIGARPQFVKAAAVSRVLRGHPDLEETIVHTGQHYDQNMSEVFFKDLDIPRPHHNLDVGSGSHAEQTASMLVKLEKLLKQQPTDAVIIYGDTNSTIAGVLAATKLHIPVAHIEAGLRSFNKKMPEEINRIASDHLSDILYAPTSTAMEHLRREGLKQKSVLSGDVMLDSILYYQKLVDKTPERFKIKKLPEIYNVVTIHRPSNTDDLANLKNIFRAFELIGEGFVFPAHPRIKKILTDSGIEIPGNIEVIDPVGYLQMISLLKNAHRVYTDSGGLQKEAFMLGKPCITLREETEWVETLNHGWNILTGPNTDKIVAASSAKIVESEPQSYYGNGRASQLIVSHLKDNI